MIEFEAVGKTYADGQVAIESVSLSVADGEMLALVGPSGCGKTTLMHMVNRMVTPSSGRVLIDGRDVAEIPLLDLRRSVGYVMQRGGLFPHMSVARNITVAPRLAGVKDSVARRDVPRLLELVGLAPDLANRYPDQLSGGQQQRVSIARALAGKPSILLMDEPFGAIDPVARRAIQSELLGLHAELGTTIIVVTHDIPEALLLGDRVAVLGERSRVLQIDTPDTLLGAPAHTDVSAFLGGGLDTELAVRTIDGKAFVTDAAGRTIGALGA